MGKDKEGGCTCSVNVQHMIHGFSSHCVLLQHLKTDNEEAKRWGEGKFQLLSMCISKVYMRPYPTEAGCEV